MHKAGDHSECLPGRCPDVSQPDGPPATPDISTDVSADVSTDLGTGRDGTGRDWESAPDEEQTPAHNDRDQPDRVPAYWFGLAAGYDR